MNVNDPVWVRLTPLGKKRLIEVGYETDPTKLDRWHRFQLWDLMRKFGDMMGPGFETPFVDNALWTYEPMPDARYIRSPGNTAVK